MKAALAVAASIALAIALAGRPPGRRIVQLPAGRVEVRSPMNVDGATEVRGAPTGTTLSPAAGFTARTIIVVHGAGVVLRDFSIDGNRAPGADGVLAEDAVSLSIRNVRLRNIAGFAIRVVRSRGVEIDGVRISDSGSRNAAGRNDTTGGILLEEGTSDFRVTHCDLRNVLGNGIWTHSQYTSPRNAAGEISLNRFQTIGRDAIQVGHATGIRVRENSGARIGYPEDAVDIENLAVPVAIDTAGDVDRTVYAANRFDEVNGKCVDLDGFHDGEVRGNVCVNRAAIEQYRYGQFGIVMNNSNPDMQSRNIRIEDNVIDGAVFGGIFVIGTSHLITGNRLLNLNLAHREEPDLLASGIYLGQGAARPAPAAGNRIEDNEITGYKMATRCIAFAPGVRPEANTIRNNRCR